MIDERLSETCTQMLSQAAVFNNILRKHLILKPNVITKLYYMKKLITQIPCSSVFRMLLGKARSLHRLYVPKTSIETDMILNSSLIIAQIKYLTLRAVRLSESSIEALSQLALSLERIDIAGCRQIGNNGKIA